MTVGRYFALWREYYFYHKLEVLYMGNNIEKHTILVEGMSCGHCEKAVESAVVILPGVLSAKVDLAAKTLIVEFDTSKVSLSQIKETVDEEGYTVV
jgi:copper chaperone